MTKLENLYAELLEYDCETINEAEAFIFELSNLIEEIKEVENGKK